MLSASDEINRVPAASELVATGRAAERLWMESDLGPACKFPMRMGSQPADSRRPGLSEGG